MENTGFKNRKLWNFNSKVKNLSDKSQMYVYCSKKLLPLMILFFTAQLLPLTYYLFYRSFNLSYRSNNNIPLANGNL